VKPERRQEKNDPQPIVRDPTAEDSNQLLPWADCFATSQSGWWFFIHLEKY
jgi:hypothetical protein